MSPEDIKQVVEALSSLPEWQYLRQAMDGKAKLEEEEEGGDDETVQMAEGEPMHEEPDEDEESLEPAKLRLQRDAVKRQFAKARREWEAKATEHEAGYKKLFQRVQDLERRERVAHRKSDLMQLEAEGYAFADFADELETVADMEPARYAKHLNTIKKNYRKAPVGVNVKIASVAPEGGLPTADRFEIMRQAHLKAQSNSKENR